MEEQHYNLPMVRENFVSRNIKKLLQGIFNIKKRKRKQKGIQFLAKKEKQNNALNNSETTFVAEHQKVDIYEFQNMYLKGEISIENMNDDQKYALVKLFGMQNEKLKESIKEHRKNTELYNMEVEQLKKELEIIR